MSSDATVYVCDDEEHVRDSLRFMLREHGLNVCALDGGPAFLSMLDAAPQPPRGVLLLDVRMDPMSGPQLHDQLIARGLDKRMPIIFLSGHGQIPLVVEAMNKGAFNFLEKPAVANALIELVRAALVKEEQWHQDATRRDFLRSQLEKLSPTLRAVIPCIAAGEPHKIVGDRFERSERWAQDRRADLFSALRVGSAPELATLVAEMRGLGLAL